MIFEDYSKEFKKRADEIKKKNNPKQAYVQEFQEKYADVIHKADLERTINFSTFQSDLSSMGKTIEGIYGGWQTPIKMKSARKSIVDMQNRIKAYQEYRKLYGAGDFPDLSEVVGGYQSILNEWNDLSESYAGYTSAEAYNKEKETLKGLYSMPTSEIKSKMDGINGIYKTAKDYENEIANYKGKEKVWKHRGNGLINDLGYGEKITAKEKEYNEFLKNAGYSSAEELKKATSGIAYTTASGENITWKELYDSAYLKEYEAEIDKTFSIGQPVEYKKKDAKYSKTWNGYTVVGDEFAHKYNYINGDEEAKNVEELINVHMYGTGDSKKDAFYTEEEKRRFNLIAENQGEERALEYAKLLDSDLRQRRAEHEKAFYAEMAKEDPVGASIVSVIDNLGNNALALPFLAMDYADDGSIDENSSLYTGRRRVQTERSAVESMIDSDVGQFFYRHGMNTADNVAAMAMSGFGKFGGLSKVIQTGIMSSGAVVDTATDAKSRGLSDGQALGLGVVAGAAEYFFESKGYDALFNTKNLTRSGWKYFVNNLVTEEIGELSTELTNDVADILISQDLSMWQQNIKSYVASGMTEKEAFNKAFKEAGLRYLDVAAGTLLSTGVISGTPAAVGSYNQHNINKEIGQKAKLGGQVSDVIDIASNPDVASAYEAYTRYASKGITADNITDAQVGRLYTNAKLDAQDVLSSKKSTLAQRENATEILNRLSAINQERSLSQSTMQSIEESTKAERDYVDEADKLISKGLETKEGTESYKLAAEMKKVADAGATVAFGDTMKLALEINKTEFAETVDKTMPKENATLAKAIYDGKTEVGEFIDSFNLVSEYVDKKVDTDYILKNKGVLTPGQVETITRTLTIEKAQARQKAIDALAEKQGKSMFVKGTVDDSLIDYTNSTKDGSRVNWKNLTSRQRDAVNFVKMFSQATGVNVRLIQSEVVDGKHVGKNGSYDPDTNTIEIDIYAGIDAGSITETIIPTLSHEVTHWMERKAPELYHALSEKVMTSLSETTGLSRNQLIDNRISKMKDNHPDMEITPEMAVNELIAKACEDMLVSSKKMRELLEGMSVKERQTFAEKVKTTLKNLMKWVNNLLKQYSSTSEEAKYLRDYKEALEEISKLWDEAFASAVNANRVLQKAGVKETEIAGESGMKFSEREIIGESGKSYGIGVYLDSNLLTGLTEDERKQMVREYVVTELAGEDFIAYDGDVPIEIGIAKRNASIKKKNGKQRTVVEELYRKNINQTIKQEAVVLADELVKAAKYKNSLAPTYSHDWLDNYGKNDWDYWKVFIQEKNKTVWEATLNIANTANGKKILYDIDPIKKVEDSVKSVSNSTLVEQASKTATSPTTNSIPQTKKKSQQQNSDRENEYMEAVERGESDRDYSNEFVDSVIKSFGIQKLGDYIHVQRQVLNTLVNENFFTDAGKRSRKDVNNASGMIVETNKSGIYETFSFNNFKRLGKDKKISKLATIRLLPEIIRDGKLLEDDVKNKYNDGSNKTFAYIEHEVNIDNKNIVVKLAIKKSPQKNKFWVHSVYTIENVNGSPASTIDGTEAGHITADIDKTITHPEHKVNSDSQNLQFSDRETETIHDLIGENERIKKENKKLRTDFDRLVERLKLERQVTKGDRFDRRRLELVAGHLRKLANSTTANEKLVPMLEEAFGYFARLDDADAYNGVQLRLNEIAEAIMADAKPETVSDAYAKLLLRNIRGSRISLSETQIQEAKNRFGDKWRNSFLGKIIIAKDGISLDSKWQEWASQYPDYFSAEVTEGEQITALFDLYDDLKDISEITVEYDTAEQARWLGQEVLNQFWNTKPIETIADKYEKRIKELNFEHRKMMKELQDDYKDRMEKQKLELRWNTAKMLHDLRTKKDSEIAEAKRLGRERLAKYRENAARKTEIQKITTDALTMNKWLTKNSKDAHINEFMKGIVAKYIQAIDFSSKQLLGMDGTVKDNRGTPTQKDISLSKALREVQNMMSSETINREGLYDLYGHDLGEDIENLVSRVDDVMREVGDNAFVLNQMSLEELKSLQRIGSTIKHAVSKMNDFHAVHHAKGLANLSQESIVYLNSLGEAKVYDDIRGTVSSVVKWDNILPYYAFKRYGAGGEKIFEAFQDGQDKLAFNVRDIIAFTEATYTDEDVKKWSEEIRTFKVPVPATETEMSREGYEPKYRNVQMTVAQVMSLYCLQKRQQAKGHMLGGGLRIANIKIDGKKDIVQTKGITLTEKGLSDIIGSLTDRQRAVADKLQEFMNTVCADWGNEISMKRFGYKAFTEENYFPIQSDANVLQGDVTENKGSDLFRLLNMSFTKSTVIGANNRIVVGNIFDVFAQHSSDMAEYNALALPVLDANKWFNYKEDAPEGEKSFETSSVKEAIEGAFGIDGQSYFTTFLKDINGAKADESKAAKLAGSFFKNAKVAAVGANLRVVLLQPTSYLRANAIIDGQYLSRALAHKPKISMAKQYCGMALWKSLGYYDTNIQRGVEEQIKHDKKFKDKLTDVSLWGAGKADELTWGYLWNACELEIRDTRKDLKVGSEEFYQTISKRLREIIYATQVVDSTMTRSQTMRRRGMYDKMITAFGSEPTLAYNMVMDAYMSYSLDKKSMGKEAAKKKHLGRIAKVLWAYTATNAVAALVEFAFDALRDDDDEKEAKDFLLMYLKNFGMDMELTSKIPYIKEIWSLAQGFDSSRTDTQGISYLVKACRNIILSKGKPATTLKYATQGISYLKGLPFYNAFKDILATMHKFDLLTAEDFNEMFKDLFD